MNNADRLKDQGKRQIWETVTNWPTESCISFSRSWAVVTVDSDIYARRGRQNTRFFTGSLLFNFESSCPLGSGQKKISSCPLFKLKSKENSVH